MNKKLIYIVILNWNGEKRISTCLESLMRISSKHFWKPVVIDNYSSDKSLQVIKQTFSHIALIKNKKNLGWAGGNNVGIKHALQHRADAILLLNNDTIVTNNFLDPLIERLFSKKEIGIISPKVYALGKKKSVIANAGNFIRPHRYFGKEAGIGEVDKGQCNTITETDYVAGTAMLIKKEVFEKIGLLNEKYFLYYEDSDFCYRARKKGFRCNFVQESIIYHKGAATSGLNSPLHNYYNTRNHYLFVEKQAPWKVKLREWLRTPKTAYEFWKSNDLVKKKYSLLGIRDYYLRRLGKQTYW